MITFNDLLGLNRFCACVFDVWSLGLAMVETVETPSDNLGWISADEESIWYNALYCVTLSLIHQYAMISVNEKEAKIFPIALDNLLYAVPTFSDRFLRLIVKCKSQLVVANIPLDLVQAHLQVHKYDSDPEIEFLLAWSAASFYASTLLLALKFALNL